MDTWYYFTLPVQSKALSAVSLPFPARLIDILLASVLR